MIRQLFASFIDFILLRTFWNDCRDTPLPLYMRQAEGVKAKRLPTKASTCSRCGVLYISSACVNAVGVERPENFECGSKACEERAVEKARVERQKMLQFQSRKLRGGR